MRKSFLILICSLLLLCGCGKKEPQAQIAATTGPVAQFAQLVTEGSGLTVTQVISESVSCLHDYSLSVGQMEAISGSEVVLISGGGLEDFMEQALESADRVVDCSAGIALHETDPHFWLNPSCAAQMLQTIADALSEQYPQHAEQFQENAAACLPKFSQLQQYGEDTLQSVSCRELITFHDGFGYLASAFDLNILAAIEEESGSEASAQALIEIIDLVNTHDLPAVFTEKNGSDAAASVIQAETGVPHYALDMGLNGDYFSVMTANIDTLKEALQ